MAREIPYIAAVKEAIHLEMARDETVLFYGQDVAPTENDKWRQAFGHDRVRVTPDLRDGRDRHGRRRWRSPATGRSSSC